MKEDFHKNSEAFEAIYDFALFLYKCAEEGELSATQIRKLLFMSQLNHKKRTKTIKRKGEVCL